MNKNMEKMTDTQWNDLYDRTVSCMYKANEIDDKELRLAMLELAITSLFTVLKP